MDEAKRRWISSVLGVNLVGSGSPKSGDAPRIDRRALFRTAKETVDEKLSILAQKLRSYGDPDLDRIADFGLFGITNGETVALNRALIECDGAAPDKKVDAEQKLRNAITAFRSVITSDKMVALLDGNPLGVDVALGATFGAALDRIEQSLS